MSTGARMQQIRFPHFGPPEVLTLSEVDRPRPGRGQVLIRVRAAGVNPKDCLVRKGKFRLFTGQRFPQGLGHDFAGEVATLGPGVDAPAPGTPVFGMRNGWRVGAYAEYALAAPDELAPIPAGLDWIAAAAVPLTAQTALQALRDLAGVRPGQRVLINGASGGVGTFAVQIARLMGAEVTAVCSARNAGLVRELGAGTAHDHAAADPLTLETRFDVWFDVFGNKGFPAARHALTRRGCYVTTVPGRANVCWHLATQLSPGRQARLVVVRSRHTDLARLAEWLEAGRLRAIVDRTYPLAEAAEAHAFVETKRARGKVVLTV